MPNYSLETSLRSFDPTRLAFLAEMQSEQTKSLREAQAAYSELMSEANLYDKLANDVMGTNSQAYKNAKSYADALRQHTDLLATQGLTNSTMRNLLMARTDAARIINPIKEGLERRQKIADYQKEYNEKHPEALWERDVSRMGIDQIMKNPNYTPKVIDRKELADRAKERYEALKNQLMEFYAGNKDMVDALSTKDPRVAKQWYKTNAPWYWETMVKYGMNPADVHRLLAGDPSMEGTLLKNIADETLRMSGFDSWNTDYDHYTAEQNAQNRANLADQVYMSILPESVNSINKTDFEQYQDNLNAQIVMNREDIASREKIAAANLAWEMEKQRGQNNQPDPDDAAQLSRETISMGYDNNTLDEDLASLNSLDYVRDMGIDENMVNKALPYDYMNHFMRFNSPKAGENPQDFLFRIWMDETNAINTYDKKDFAVGTDERTFATTADKISKLWNKPLYQDLFKQRLFGNISDRMFETQTDISAAEFDKFAEITKGLLDKKYKDRYPHNYGQNTDLPKDKQDILNRYGIDYDPSKTDVGTDYIMKDIKNTNGNVWPRFITSIADNTARKTFARVVGESLRNQGADETHLRSTDGDGYASYKIGEKFTNSDFNTIVGYDEDGEYTKVPTFWFDPKTPNTLFVQYGGSDKVFQVNTADWNGGINKYGDKVRQMAYENNRTYNLYTNYKLREELLHKVKNGDKEATKEYNKYLATIDADKDAMNNIIQIAESKGIPAKTAEQQKDIIFKSALLGYAYNLNHDGMNVIVKGGQWGQGGSGTTPEQKAEFYQFLYDNI